MSGNEQANPILCETLLAKTKLFSKSAEKRGLNLFFWILLGILLDRENIFKTGFFRISFLLTKNQPK
jgi:hypothetical protein